jgi:cytoskeleton protein RodZ
MNEPVFDSVEPIIEQPEGRIHSGAGALLRAAREAQGLHIAMLAVSLKVPVKKIEALEAERYDLLLDTVFVRALASSVCRSLGVDAAPVLAALPRTDVPKIKDSVAGLNTTFNDSSRGSGRFSVSYFGKPLSIVMAVLVLGILGIVFLPTSTSTEHVSSLLGGEPSPVIPVASVSADVSILPDGRPLPSASEALVPLTADVPAVAISQEQPQVFKASASSAALSPGVLAGANVRDLLSLRALGSSWVEVVDAKGVLQLRKTLLKDEIVPVSGVLPLAVVLGRADLVAVTVHGQPFDAVSIARDNVARFEVK